MSAAELQFRATLAERGFDAAFAVAAGEVVAVVGPNGAGKSTAAAIVAGLLSPDSATVRLGGRTLTDTDLGIQVPPHDRRVGLLQQKPLLFPHMNVLANVQFAARSGGRDGRAAARNRALRWLDEVDAAALADRRPGGLSGGQAQRVALARALAAEPEALVLDEPLSGLDVASAASMRMVLSRTLNRAGRSTLLITHDVLDILALADRVVVLEGGRVAESGPVNEVLAAPRSRFGARIAGLNLVRGRIAEPGVLITPAGQVWHGTPTDRLNPGDSAVAVFSPGAVGVYRDRPVGSPRNSVRVRIAGLEAHGPVVRVRAEHQEDGIPGPAADVTSGAVAELGLAAGDDVWFTVKTQGIALHAATSIGTATPG